MEDEKIMEKFLSGIFTEEEMEILKLVMNNDPDEVLPLLIDGGESDDHNRL